MRKEKHISFDDLHSKRKDFLKLNSVHDHVIVKGSTILLSAPHGVSQVRLGKPKVAELGSIATALYLQSSTGASLIAKTRNNNDDANFDMDSPYKDSIREMVANREIKYIVDIHGLASSRECDINLGTHLGKNIAKDPKLFELLVNELENSGFSVTIDQPFMAGSNTIAGNMKNNFDSLWTIQIEINCGITNNRANISRYRDLLHILTNWIESIERRI